MNSRRALDPRLKLVVLGIVLIGTVGYLLARALAGFELVRATPGPAGGYVLAIHNARPWLVGALCAAILSLVNWAVAERRAHVLAAALGRDRRPDPAPAPPAAGRADAAAWVSEREWRRELVREVSALLDERGADGAHGEAAGIVLELTMALVGAGEGVLVRDGEAVVARGTGDAGRTRALDAAAEHAPGRGEVLVLPLGDPAREPWGTMVCAGREGGFAGIDPEVLRAVGEQAGLVLTSATLHDELRSAYLAQRRGM